MFSLGKVTEDDAVPPSHRFVHPPAAKDGADRSLELVEEGMGVRGWLRPIEVAVLVGDGAVEGRAGGVYEAGHAIPPFGGAIQYRRHIGRDRIGRQSSTLDLSSMTFPTVKGTMG